MIYVKLTSKRFPMKRTILFAFVMILSSCLLFSSGLKLDQDVEGLTLYNETGVMIPSDSEMNEGTFIILTKAERAVFTSPFGNVYLFPDSILAVTGLSEEGSSFYLVSGMMDIVLSAELPVEVFTPTSSFSISGAGEYLFVSTDDEEALYNLSGSSSAEYYDSILGRSGSIRNMSYVSAFSGIMDQLSPNRYNELTVLDLMVPDAPGVSVSSSLESPATPKMPSVTIPETEVPAIPESPQVYLSDSYLTGEVEIVEVIVDEPETGPEAVEVRPAAPSVILSESMLTGTPDEAATAEEAQDIPQAPVVSSPLVSVYGENIDEDLFPPVVTRID